MRSSTTPLFAERLVISLSLSVLTASLACNGTPAASGPTLRFRSDGTFKIVQFTDTQDDQDIDPRTVHLMEEVLDDQHPDLVVFTGDNIRSGPETPEDVWKAIDNIAAPVDTRAIPWLIAFGNHDEEHQDVTGVDEEAMLARYMSYAHNVNRPGPTGVSGTGNMHVLILGSQADDPVFNVWALDAGRYTPDSIAGQAVADDGLSSYAWISHSQIAWYCATSEALERQHGRKIPSMMFFHIPLPEFDLMWQHREHHSVVGERNEGVAAGAFNSGLFVALLERGDVRGVFVGHDHVNDYVGDYFGVRLGFSANTGFGTYGLDGAERDRLRGARVFVLHEDDPSRFETYMVYARDYGI